METYISILRGINVTGSKVIKMTDLEKIYHDLGFQDVKTYIQSGNVVFKSDAGLHPREISAQIEKEIQSRFGYIVPVIIRTPEELRSVISSNPFRHGDGTVAKKIYITFLEDIPLPENIEKIRSINFYPDRFSISGKEIYIDCAAGYGTTKLSNTFFEKSLKTRATTRNWNTVTKLLEMTE